MDETQAHAIVRGLRQGRTDAWHALYDAYAEQVWRAVARLLGPSSTDVADVVQETFLAAARSARNYDHQRGSLWQWLWGIARTQVALHYRKQTRFARVAKEAPTLALEDGQLQRWLDGMAPAPIHAIAQAELAALVRTTLLDLPDDYETLLTAKYLDGKSVEELASAERSTTTAVRSKLARAREAFRRLFVSRHPDEEKGRRDVLHD